MRQAVPATAPDSDPIQVREQMPTTYRLLGIAGSIRSAAFSKAVLTAVAELASPGAPFDFADIGAPPHFNQDLYVDPLPAAVQHFRAQTVAADGRHVRTMRRHSSISRFSLSLRLRLSPAVSALSTRFGNRWFQRWLAPPTPRRS